MQAQDLITESLKELGELAPGEVASSDDLNDGLAKLNELIALWSIKRLNIFCIFRAQYAVTSGTAQYQIGPSQTWNATRPVAIQAAAYIPAGGNFRFSMKIVGAPEFTARTTDATRQGNYAEILWYDSNYPTGMINIWPVPAASGASVELYTWEQLTQLGSLVATFDMPPGYQLALRLNLAVALAPAYGRPVMPELMKNAMEAVASLRGLDAPPSAGMAQEIQGAGASTPVPPDAGESIG